MSAPVFSPDMTRRGALRRAEAILQQADLGEPETDARILVEEATGFNRSALLYGDEAPLGHEAAARLGAMVARRLAREPVFRIAGRREFWGLDLLVTPAVLDPRPDTETIVRAALRALGSRRAEQLRVLDLGTGSGAILLALLSELPHATGLGIDRSPDACRVAARNASTCGLGRRTTIQTGDWSADLTERFDLVVSNPPYVETAAIPALDPEVRDHDPRLALDGGFDGLDAYRAICPALPGLLASAGLAVLEIGAGQALDVVTLFGRAGLIHLATERDLGGHERAVLGRVA